MLSKSGFAMFTAKLAEAGQEEQVRSDFLRPRSGESERSDCDPGRNGGDIWTKYS